MEVKIKNKRLHECGFRFNVNTDSGNAGDISPDNLYYYQNAVPKILNEKDAQVPIVIVKQISIRS